ncbi:hypothetical protein EVAR_17848_1 [Eumeta japonica]|uniref:Uncharacterized protein n=1 Tax=Eumeta variegata TaxID=151549 RepID=A0A4C1TTY9_EUMVA|nr:hypothetical protein EVAR_17848_1 [Eumeta japonica]
MRGRVVVAKDEFVARTFFAPSSVAPGKNALTHILLLSRYCPLVVKRYYVAAAWGWIPVGVTGWGARGCGVGQAPLASSVTRGP